MKKRDSLKGVAVQGVLEGQSRRISIVRSRYQATACEDTVGWKSLAGAMVICKVWKLAVEL